MCTNKIERPCVQICSCLGQVFGFDFLVQRDGAVTRPVLRLLEVNSGPAMEGECHPVGVLGYIHPVGVLRYMHPVGVLRYIHPVGVPRCNAHVCLAHDCAKILAFTLNPHRKFVANWWTIPSG